MLYLYFFLTNLMMCEFIYKIFMFWFFMEINSLMFILLSYMTNNFFQSYYFIISSISSIFLIIFIIFQFYNFLMFFIFTKLGIFPFNYWMFKIFSLMDKKFLILILSLQKIPLVFLIMKIMFNEYFFSFLNIMILIFILFYSFNFYFNLLIISIFSNSILMIISSMNINLIYLYMTLILLDLFLIYNKKMKIFLNKMNKFYLMIISFSLMGLPVFPMFFIKLNMMFIIYNNININFLLILFLMFIYYLILLYKNFILLNNMKFYFDKTFLIYFILLMII